MKINYKLVALLLFIAFLGSIVPLTLNLLKIYDTVSENLYPIVYQTLIWCGIATVLSSLSIIFLLSNKSKARKKLKENLNNNTEDQNTDSESKTIPEGQNSSLTESDVKKAFINNNNIQAIGESILKTISKKIEIVQGVFYVKVGEEYQFTAGYALNFASGNPKNFIEGDGILGQSVKSLKHITIDTKPDESNIVKSGLGEALPSHLLISPIIYKKKAIGLLELGSFKSFSDEQINSINSFNTLIANEIQSFLKKPTDTSK